VLFLSRRNSARSIMAEAIVNRHGQGRFRGFSAGVKPQAAIEHPALDALSAAGYSTHSLRPKHYHDYAAQGAADLDFVFTLSDTAAGEPMPQWPGHPVTAHWPCQDPVLVRGEVWEQRRAYGVVLAELERRLRIFMSLPFASLDRLSLKGKIEEIGRQ